MKKYSLDKSKIKVLLVEGIHENAVELFRGNGYSDIEYYKEALSDEELTIKLQHTHIIGIRSRQKLTSSLLQRAPKLITAGCFSIGRRSTRCRRDRPSGRG